MVLEGKKTLVKFAGLTVILNLLVKPIWLFLFDRKVQATLGNADYGTYFSAFNLAFLASILLDFGMSYWNNRALAFDEAKQRKYQQAIFTLKGFFSLMFLGLGLCLSLLTSLKGDALLLFWGGMMLQWFSHWLSFFRSVLSGIQKFGWDAFFSVLDRLLAMLGVGWLLWDHRISASSFAWIQAASYALSAFLVFLLLRRFQFRWSFSSNPGIFKEILRSSFPFFVMVMAMSLYARLDGIMLDRVFQLPKEAGAYAAFFRLYEAGIIFPTLIAGVLTPLVARHLGSGLSIADVLQTGASWILLPAVGVVGALYSYPQPIFDVVYQGDALPSDLIQALFPMVGLVFFFHSVVLLYGATLTAMGELKWLIFWALGSAVLALLFHVILIPQHGALGAAWATAVGHGCMAMGCFWGVLKKSGLKKELLKKGWRIGIFLSLLLAFLYWDPLVFELGLWVWFLMLGLSAVMLRLLDLRTFSLFLKKSA